MLHEQRHKYAHAHFLPSNRRTTPQTRVQVGCARLAPCGKAAVCSRRHACCALARVQRPSCPVLPGCPLTWPVLPCVCATGRAAQQPPARLPAQAGGALFVRQDALPSSPCPAARRGWWRPFCATGRAAQQPLPGCPLRLRLPCVVQDALPSSPIEQTSFGSEDTFLRLGGDAVEAEAEFPLRMPRGSVEGLSPAGAVFLGFLLGFFHFRCF